MQDHGQALEALRCYRELGRRLAREKSGPGPLLEVARHLCFLYAHEDAHEWVEAAVRQAGRAPALIVRAALLMAREGLYETAARWARQVLAAPGADAAATLDARLLLAECCERLGRLEEALAVAAEVLASRPASLPAQRLRAAVLRRQGKLDDALAALDPLLRHGAPPHWETCRAWFELGHVQDARGAYAGAWQAWLTARRFYPPETDWKIYQQQAAHVWQHVRAVHRAVTPEHLARWSDAAPAGEGPARLAILTGHPRSGTTLLEQALDAHSGIISAEETTIFTSNIYRPLFQHGPPVPPDQRLDGLTLAELAHWRHEYLGLTRLALRQEAGPRLLLDKNPDLLQLLPAVARVFPEARMVVMLRDPRDLLVSMFSQALPPNHTAWSYRSPEAAARMVSLRLGLWHHLRTRLPAARFHEVRYEQAVRDFPRAVDGVLGFLGCASEKAAHDPAAHARQRLVLSPTYAAVREPVHTRAVARWRHYEEWLAPVLPILEPALKWYESTPGQTSGLS